MKEFVIFDDDIDFDESTSKMKNRLLQRKRF